MVAIGDAAGHATAWGRTLCRIRWRWAGRHECQNGERPLRSNEMSSHSLLHEVGVPKLGAASLLRNACRGSALGLLTYHRSTEPGTPKEINWDGRNGQGDKPWRERRGTCAPARWRHRAPPASAGEQAAGRRHLGSLVLASALGSPDAMPTLPTAAGCPLFRTWAPNHGGGRVGVEPHFVVALRSNTHGLSVVLSLGPGAGRA